MKYFTIRMIARHVGRTPQAVGRALSLSNKFKPERHKGVRGIRLTEKQAADFVALHWPEAPSMKEAAK